MDGDVKGLPVPAKLPPVAASYQFTVPAEAVADKETVPVPQRLAEVVPVIVGKVYTESVAAFELIIAPQAPSNTTLY